MNVEGQFSQNPHLLLSLSLAVAVPNDIVDLYQRFKSEDGIPSWMVGEAIVFGGILAERGDRLLFKSERKGETADLFVGFARTLSILSFVPAGVSFAAQHFDALPFLTARYGEEEACAFCQKALRPYFDAVVEHIPVVCWSTGSEPIAFGSYNILRWFEHAEVNDLLALRENHYQGSAISVANASSPLDYAHNVLSEICRQARNHVQWSPTSREETPSVERLGDQLLLASRDRSQEIAFQVEPNAAEAWLALYRHALLTGERWLLPHEPQQKQKSAATRKKATSRDPLP